MDGYGKVLFMTDWYPAVLSVLDNTDSHSGRHIVSHCTASDVSDVSVDVRHESS